MGVPIDAGATAPLRERAAFNEAQLRIVAFINEQHKAYYQLAVNNWISLQAHGATQDPVPDPPRRWDALPRTNLTQDQIDFDNRFGLPPMLVPTETLEPVVPKYIPAPEPSHVGPVIGVSLGGGWFSAGYVEAGHEIQDKTDPGVRVNGTSRDGITGTFQKVPAVVGPGWWLKVA